MNFAALSYGLCSAGFLLLFLLLLTRWRGRLTGASLVLAVLMTLCWAAVATVGSAGLIEKSTGPLRFLAVYQVLEVLRTSTWLALLFELMRPLLQARHLRRAAFFYPGLVLSSLLLLAVELGSGVYLAPGLAFKISAYAHLAYALLGLMMIENLFRNTSKDGRWASKFLFLGLGMVFVYDFYLYADALLLERINLQIWSARGAINALAVPLLAVTAARNPQWSLDIFVSRRIVVHTFAMAGAGLYLLAMAVAGYYLRFFGGTWGGALQLVFFAGSALLLAIMLFSGQLRSALMVFLSKHFFNYKYDYREEWLRFGETLGASDSRVLPRQRAIRALAQILHSQGGLLWTRDDSRLRLHAAWRIAAPTDADTGIDVAGVKMLEQTRWVVDLNDYRARPEHYPGLVLPGWLLAREDFWVLVPLLQGERLVGVVVLADSISIASYQLNWEDWDLLKTAGQQVAGYVALLEANEALMDASQFDAFNRLSAFVVHDLKNVSAQLSLVVKNAEKHRHNPAFIDDALATVGNAAERMNRMLAQLRKGIEAEQAATTFAVAEALAEAAAARAQTRPQIDLRLPSRPLYLHASRDRFVAVIEHLLQNAQEATADDGEVSLSADEHQQQLRLRVRDNGCGMDEVFIRERLFRPFATTKGNAGMGIGIYECRVFVQSLNGTVSVRSRPGEGSEFVVRLPLAPAPQSPAAAGFAELSG